MTFNKFMHPRNPYRVPPDFKQVAIEYPEFCKHVYQDLCGKLKYNFKDPNALRVFTTTLLHKDFGLNVNIPTSRLVPTLPLRLNYILWIEDLLALNEMQAPFFGIDLGTGASCIYPLLGHRKNLWHMLALDTDALSCEWAQRNVAQNGLEEFVTVKNNSSAPYALEPWLDPGVNYSFTMCNPPFHTSGEAALPGKQKLSAPRRKLSGVTVGNGRPPPSNGHTGSEGDLITSGGEVEFVKSFVEANAHLAQIKIFTTMLGYKSSFVAVKKFLSQQSFVKKIAATEFCQGNTMRWALAWTLSDSVQLQDELPRKTVASGKSKPVLCVVQAESVGAVLSRVVAMCDKLKIVYKVLQQTPNSCRLNIAARENTWSNQRRAKRRKLAENETHEPQNSSKTQQCNNNNERVDGSISEHCSSNSSTVELKEHCSSNSSTVVLKEHCSTIRSPKETISSDNSPTKEHGFTSCDSTTLQNQDSISNSRSSSNSSIQHTSNSDGSDLNTEQNESSIPVDNSSSSERTTKSVVDDLRESSESAHCGESPVSSKSAECGEPPAKKTKTECYGAKQCSVEKNGVGHVDTRQSSIDRVDNDKNNVDSSVIEKIDANAINIDTKGVVDVDKKGVDRVNIDKSVDSAVIEKIGVDAVNIDAKGVDRVDMDKISVPVVNKTVHHKAPSHEFKLPLVECNLLLEQVEVEGRDGVALEMIWMSGTGSRDLPHQIIQYMKNNLGR